MWSPVNSFNLVGADAPVRPLIFYVPFVNFRLYALRNGQKIVYNDNSKTK